MDCLEGMKLIPDGTIDLVVTSPPYDNLREYGDGQWSVDLSLVGKEISRVLKDGGICVMVIQDQTKNGRKSLTSFRTIIDWVDKTEMDLWECCIYQRSGTPGAWWSKRFRVDHEYIPIFIKGKRPNYFNKEHMKIPSQQHGMIKKGKERKNDGTFTEYTYNETRYPKKKCCGTIINYESARASDKSNKLKTKHPAWFPDLLAEDFIKAFTQEGDIVLDPFIGSGTTGKMAIKNNRKYIGFEINEEYIEHANKHIHSS